MSIEIMNSGGAEKVKINGERVREKLELEISNYNLTSTDFEGHQLSSDQVCSGIIDINQKYHYLYHPFGTVADSNLFLDDDRLSCVAVDWYSGYKTKLIDKDLVYDFNHNCAYIMASTGLTNQNVYPATLTITNYLYKKDYNTNTVTELYKQVSETKEYPYNSSASGMDLEYNNFLLTFDNNIFCNAKLLIHNGMLYCLTFLTNSAQIKINKFNFTSNLWEEIFTI
jgi:hypothetical protein